MNTASLIIYHRIKIDNQQVFIKIIGNKLINITFQEMFVISDERSMKFDQYLKNNNNN